ncbi:MAG: hypothetical protein IT529_09650 [Burkholderiales bacterium]|nr:hypothetical protein [Burkholderiales bacterium]
MKRRRILQAGCGLIGAGMGGGYPAALAQGPTFSDAQRTRDRIVAVVRAFDPGYKKPLPDVQQVKPVPDVAVAGVDTHPDELPLIDYFVGDLQLRYSFDDAHYLTSVSAADLKRLKLKREELLPLAIANFRRRYPGVQVERMPGGIATVGNAGDLEPSLMLDSGFWDLERNRAGSDIVAAVPARDTLVFASRASATHVGVLKRVTGEVHEAAGGDALSRKLYLWFRGRWEVFA